MHWLVPRFVAIEIQNLDKKSVCPATNFYPLAARKQGCFINRRFKIICCAEKVPSFIVIRKNISFGPHSASVQRYMAIGLWV